MRNFLIVVVGIVGVQFGSVRSLAQEPPGSAKPAPGITHPGGEVVEVPSQRDGILLLTGTEIQPGEKVPNNRMVKVRSGGQEITYRRWREGDRVEEGQLLARLDDRLARDEVAIKRTRLVASEAELIAALKTRDEAKARFERYQELAKRGALDPSELGAAKLTWERYEQEAVSRKAAVEVAGLELKQAQTLLEMYEIRSPLRGVIQAIYRKRGEAVRGLEPVFRIQSAEDR